MRAFDALHDYRKPASHRPCPACCTHWAAELVLARMIEQRRNHATPSGQPRGHEAELHQQVRKSYERTCSSAEGKAMADHRTQPRRNTMAWFEKN